MPYNIILIWEKIVKFKHEGILMVKFFSFAKSIVYRVSALVLHFQRKILAKHEKGFGLDFSEYKSNMYGVNSDMRDYWPSEKKYVLRIFRELDYSKGLKFLDIGCGKGYVLYLASKYPFNNIAGIEYSKDLFLILKKNIIKLRMNVEIYNRDARDFDAYGDYNVFYFYNPFGQEIMRMVMQAILSQMKKGVEYIIIYYNPVCANTILESGVYKLEKKFFIARGVEIHIYVGELS